MPGDRGEHWASLVNKSWSEPAEGFTVRPVAFDGADYVPLLAESDGMLKVTDTSVLGTLVAIAASVSSLPPLKVEDTAHVSGAGGDFILGVRNDAAAATLTSTDGDYSPLAVDGQGRLMVTGTSSMTALKVDGSAVTQPVSLPAVSEAGYSSGALAFGSINGSAGAYVTLITMASPAAVLTIFNGTDQPITVSFDASTTHGYVPARGSWTVDYQAALRKETSNVSVRYETATTGLSGKVYGNAVT